MAYTVTGKGPREIVLKKTVHLDILFTRQWEESVMNSLSDKDDRRFLTVVRCCALSEFQSDFDVSVVLGETEPYNSA